MLRKIIFLQILIILIGGCSDDLTKPKEGSEYRLQLIPAKETIYVANRAEANVQVKVYVSKENYPVGGVEVALTEGSGVSLDRSTVVTGDDGFAETTARYRFPTGVSYNYLRVTAKALGTSTEMNVTVYNSVKPMQLTLSSSRIEGIVASDEEKTISISGFAVDSSGRGVYGVPLKAYLGNGSGEIFGRITSPYNRTDNAGEFSIEFNNLGKTGSETLFVSTNYDFLTGEQCRTAIPVRFSLPGSNLASLSLIASPDNVLIEPGETAAIDLRASLLDSTGVPAGGFAIIFSSSAGELDTNVAVTDEFGVARNRLGVRSGVREVIVSVIEAKSGLEASDTIDILGYFNPPYSLLLTSDVPFIYADNGLTTARISAVHFDRDHQAMTGERIFFSTTHGLLTSPKITDANGRAETILTDIGLPSLDSLGNIVPAMIIARTADRSASDTCYVEIRPRNPVTNITLFPDRDEYEVSETDSITLRAAFFLRSGAFAPTGWPVLLEVQRAGRISTVNSVIGQLGEAIMKIPVGTVSGFIQFRLCCIQPGDLDTIWSNTSIVAIHPGPAKNVRLTASPNRILIGDPFALSVVTATVTDTFGNPIRQGELVRFTTSKGDVTPSALIDTMGQARARLTAGVEEGLAVVTASVTTRGGGIVSGTVVVTLYYGISMELSIDHPVLQPPGSGGDSIATINTYVRDSNGRPAEHPNTVCFQLINSPAPPLGPVFPSGGAFDSIRTVNGVGSIELKSGRGIGGVMIRIYTWRDSDSSSIGEDNRLRTDTLSLVFQITVLPGPPVGMELDYDPDGEDVGGGAWQIPISARLWDLYRNPVANRIPVVYEVEPQIATAFPGFTGNDIGQGATPGVAFSRLYYRSLNSGDTIRLSGETDGAGGVVRASIELQLPLQDGELSLTVDPQNWMFDRENQSDTAFIRVTANLWDGHQIALSGFWIRFRANHGRFYRRDPDDGRMIPFHPEPARAPTDGGSATVYLGLTQQDIDWMLQEGTVNIEAEVEGYDLRADPAFVFVTRR